MPSSATCSPWKHPTCQTSSQTCSQAKIASTHPSSLSSCFYLLNHASKFSQHTLRIPNFLVVLKRNTKPASVDTRIPMILVPVITPLHRCTLHSTSIFGPLVIFLTTPHRTKPVSQPVRKKFMPAKVALPQF